MQLHKILIGMGIFCGLVGCGASGDSKQLQSDKIVEGWDRLDGKWWLLPNLKDARVVLPDRPHSRSEIDSSHQGAAGLKRVREYRLSTSSLRLRGPELGAKKDGVIRIAAVGDSVTHGWGVTRAESYPAQLEQALTQRGYAVEVINAGVPANRLDTMEAWCRVIGKELEVDWVLWTRRPNAALPNPTDSYRRHLTECQRHTGAQVMVVLPPISTFDPRGIRNYKREGQGLRQALGDQVPLLELTDVFHEAQKGRGEVLIQADGKQRVVDQESGAVWMEVDAPVHSGQQRPSPALNPKIYTLFEAEPEVREALFFDEGHPDAEGFKLFAATVADAWIAELQP